MSNKDSTQKTLVVALLLCLVCSVIVSTAAVLLKPAQTANKNLDFKRNILAAAGLLDPSLSVEEQFQQVTVKLVDLDTGKFTNAVPVDKYDQRKASKDTALSQALAKEEDLAKISRREHYAQVYLVEGENGYETVILPVRGYGLWSTLYGFLALSSDYETVVGLGFYEHAETPGLGGEVDNPRWKSSWQGKKVFNTEGKVAIEVIKGSVDPQSPNADYQIDGLSGATLTARGVHNLMQFWLGAKGYGPFLENMQRGEA